MTTVASPRAASIPAVIASWWPKLREKSMSFRRGSAAHIARRTSPERSSEPSLTKMTSKRMAGVADSIAATRRRRNSSMLASSR